MLYILAIASMINLSMGIAPREVWVSGLLVAVGGMGVTMVVPAAAAAAAAGSVTTQRK